MGSCSQEEGSVLPHTLMSYPWIGLGAGEGAQSEGGWLSSRPDTTGGDGVFQVGDLVENKGLMSG